VDKRRAVSSGLHTLVRSTPLLVTVARVRLVYTFLPFVINSIHDALMNRPSRSWLEGLSSLRCSPCSSSWVRTCLELEFLPRFPAEASNLSAYFCLLAVVHRLNCIPVNMARSADCTRTDTGTIDV
jgi:hypothetical protein